ncbi:MAG TPA: DUF916 domain-containing protein [Gryllotalpicola sp.]
MTNSRAAFSSSLANAARSGIRLAALALVAALAVAAAIAQSQAAHAAAPRPGASQPAKPGAAKTSKPAPSKPAGPAVTWSVSPATATNFDAKRNFYDYSAKPGVTLSDHVAVTNYSSRPIAFHVYAADGTTDYKTAKFTLISGKKTSKDLGSWVSVEGGPSNCPAGQTGAKLTACLAKLGTTVTVQPKTAVIIPFRVAVPKNASPGDHAAGIVAAYTEKGNGTTAVAVEQRVGARVYLRVAGKLAPSLRASGAVIGFHGGMNPFGGGSASVGFDLTDSGNTRLSAGTTVKVTGPFGIPVTTLTAPPVENLLPGGVAHVQLSVPKGVPRLFLLFGGITVKAQHADGNATGDVLPGSTKASAMTWAVPWVWLLIALVVAAGVVGALWWRRRSREQLAVALHQYVLQVQADAARGELVAHAGEQEPQR